MQFRTFIWPNEPETLKISFQRKVEMLPSADGLWSISSLGRMGRVFEGEGVFYGADAYTTFSSLAKLLYDGAAGTLTLPHWQEATALLTALEVCEEPCENYLKYRFTFLETPPQ